MSIKWKSWLLLGGIFVVGIITGAALAIGLGPRFHHPPGAQEMRVRWMMHLSQQLGLTADQQAKIQPILADAGDQLQKLHHEEIDQGAKIFKETDDKIAALLTPDQKTKLDQMEAQMEAEREKMFMNRQHAWDHPGGPGAPGGPPPGGPGAMNQPWQGNGMPPAPGDTNAPPPGPPPAETPPPPGPPPGT